MRRVIYFILAAFYYALIFFFSSKSYGVHIKAGFFDKEIHCLEFAVLALFLSFGFFKIMKSSLRNKALLTVFSGLFLGLLDEVHQYFVPERQFEILDILADGIGVIIGFYLYFFLSRRFKLEKKFNQFFS